MDIKNIVLNERSQTQKNIYCMILSICNSRKCKMIYGGKIKIAIASRGVETDWKRLRELSEVMGYTRLCIFQNSLNGTLNICASRCT